MTVLDGLEVACPECNTTLPIPVRVTIVDDETNGRQHPEFDPDYTDVWAHLWAAHPDAADG